MTVLKRGGVFFFYRPKVGDDDVRSLDDVQRLYDAGPTRAARGPAGR